MEASGRVGGRMSTVYRSTVHGDDWYGDLGAMRFPGDNILINGVRMRTCRNYTCDKVNIISQQG